MIVDVASVLERQLDELAAVVGRLRRRVEGDAYAEHLVDWLAGDVDVLDSMMRPSAGEICAANIRFGADEDEAVVAAVSDVDDRVRHLRSLLREKTR